MSTKIFNICLPTALLSIIDNQAKLNYSTRSEYIKTTILARLKADGALNESGEQIIQTLNQARKAQLKAFFKDYQPSDDDDDYY